MRERRKEGVKDNYEASTRRSDTMKEVRQVKPYGGRVSSAVRAVRGRTRATLGTPATSCSTGLGCISIDVMAAGVGAGMKMAKGRPRGGRRSSCRGRKMSHNGSSQ